LRPENELALSASGLTHDDLLTLSDLDPILTRKELSTKINGLILVDHNQLLSDWGDIGESKVIGLLDHHHDKGFYPDANPRIIEMTESCTTLIAREVLHELHTPRKLPKTLIDLMLRTIALDTSDFKHGHDSLDHQVRSRLLPLVQR
jgi:exopolyphosphatase